MSKQLSLTFSKYDKFSSPVFYTSTGNEAYATLERYADKIKVLGYSNTPIYKPDNSKYILITFLRSKLLQELTPNCIYAMEIALLESKKNETKYLNFSCTEILSKTTPAKPVEINLD